MDRVPNLAVFYISYLGYQQWPGVSYAPGNRRGSCKTNEGILV